MSDTTFQDTPLYAWLRANAWFLLAAVVLVSGIYGYRYWSAQSSASDRVRSWESYRSLTGPEAAEADLSARLARAKGDDRIYPWLVFESARQAAAASDASMMDVLRPELQALETDDRFRVATPNGSAPLGSFLLAQLSGSGKLPGEFENPEPDGKRVEIVVSLPDEKTYAVVAGLYEALCPTGAGAFAGWVEGGRMADQSARLIGTSGLTISLTKQPAPAEGDVAPKLMIERPHGLFHTEGILSMLQLPGQFGAQDQDAVQLLLQDSFHLDAQATVLGKVLEGWEPLKAALAAAGPNPTIKVVSARVL